jgi:hypothetical protein
MSSDPFADLMPEAELLVALKVTAQTARLRRRQGKREIVDGVTVGTDSLGLTWVKFGVETFYFRARNAKHIESLARKAASV